MRVEPYNASRAAELTSQADVCVSFNGGAWRGIFYLGIVEYFQATFSEATLASWRFCGVSSGCCFALALAIQFPAQRLAILLCHAACRARRHSLGVGLRVNSIAGDVIRVMLDSIKEDELLRRLHNRFAICFSGVASCCALRPYIAKDFASKSALFQAIVGSSYIPLYHGIELPPRLCGVRAIDGTFTRDGCVPLLPAKRFVYICCTGVATRPLPARVAVAVVPVPAMPLFKCILTPNTDVEVHRLAAEGRAHARALFASDEFCRS